MLFRSRTRGDGRLPRVDRRSLAAEWRGRGWTHAVRCGARVSFPTWCTKCSVCPSLVSGAKARAVGRARVSHACRCRRQQPRRLALEGAPTASDPPVHHYRRNPDGTGDSPWVWAEKKKFGSWPSTRLRRSCGEIGASARGCGCRRARWRSEGMRGACSVGGLKWQASDGGTETPRLRRQAEELAG